MLPNQSIALICVRNLYTTIETKKTKTERDKETELGELLAILRPMYNCRHANKTSTRIRDAIGHIVA